MVLREVARILRQSSREIDEPARYGGEELAVALPQTDIEGAYLRRARPAADRGARPRRCSTATGSQRHRIVRRRLARHLGRRQQGRAGRRRRRRAFDSNYVPGWDCHGLPIEWQIEQEYRAKGKRKEDVPVLQLIDECRAFAAEWIDIQRAEFKRLGVEGDWDHPYMTMAPAAEAQIARELMKFAATGQLYRGSKPVMWSVVEKTALAEAEIEYHDYTSDTVWVKFPIDRYDRRDRTSNRRSG